MKLLRRSSIELVDKLVKLLLVEVGVVQAVRAAGQRVGAVDGVADQDVGQVHAGRRNAHEADLCVSLELHAVKMIRRLTPGAGRVGVDRDSIHLLVAAVKLLLRHAGRSTAHDGARVEEGRANVALAKDVDKEVRDALAEELAEQVGGLADARLAGLAHGGREGEGNAKLFDLHDY